MSPYWGADLFSFFSVLIQRCFLFVQGVPLEIASDEIQILVLSAVAISCGLISPFLVLKRMTMLANSISHTILLGISLSALVAGALWGGGIFHLPTLLIGSLLAALLTSFFTEGLTRFFRLQEDASIGLVFTALFALGIVIVTLYLRDAHLGVEAVMGNADALQLDDVWLPTLFIGVNAVAVTLFFKQFQIGSFDRNLAQTLGIPVGFFRYLLLFLTSATCIGAFRSVGVLLVLAFLTGPYLTARLFSHRLPRLIVLTSAFGALAAMVGVALSRHLLTVYDLPLSTGGLVVVTVGLQYVIAVAAFHWKNRRRGHAKPV